MSLIVINSVGILMKVEKILSFLRTDNRCVAKCPDAYYSEEDERKCVKCYVTCVTCRGHHSTNCLTCKADHFMSENSCVEKCTSR